MEVRSIEAIIRALNEAEVQYLIVGGLAVTAHGFVRLTTDIDIVIGLEPSNITRGIYALKEIGYSMNIPVSPEQFADATLRQSWREQKGMIVLKMWSDAHRRTPIDIFVYEPFDFAQEFAAATQETIIEGVKAPVVRYETLVAMKREAGRPQDLIDLEELARAQRLRQEGVKP